MAETEREPRYREIRRLGTGGMATVTLAEDTVLGRRVALKRVYASGDPRERLRLRREALVGASLNHPNLVFVYDVGTQSGGDLVIVMEYVDGESLSEVIDRHGGAPNPREALRVLSGVAAGLDAIHAQGIVHRDVKPANVLLGPDGAVKLADLGVADLADRTRTTSAEAVVGTFSYMAVEQLEGAPPRPAMDVYALAAVAYELLSGKKARPEPNPVALAHAISTRPAPDLRTAWPGAPAAAASVLKRGMSRDPSERPSSAGELVRRLQRALEPEGATRAVPAIAFAKQVKSSPRAVGRRPVARLLPALVGLAAVVIAGVAVAALSSGSHTGTRAPAAASARAARSRRPTTTGSARRSGAPSASAAAQSAPSRPSAASSKPAPGPGSAPASGAAGSAAIGSQPVTPSGAVEAFYEAAAAHQYPTAWALADASMRTELGGFLAFQNEMSSVRAIAFRRAQVLGGQGSRTATVALQTTSVQSGRTQQCAGTANTVQSGGVWLLDGISISCS